jgi:single-stranded-DNA-specific exonuclease
MTKTLWLDPEPITAEADAELAKFHPVVRQVLFQRGIRSGELAARFIAKPLDALHDPMALGDMPAAVDLIQHAIEHDLPIVVFGDYDVDGVTGTALLLDALRTAGARASSYLPNRFDEGYGLNLQAVDRIRDDGAGLLITVDCGVRGVDEVAHAKAGGLQVVVTDHHHPGPIVPSADAILNPRLPGNDYPYDDLAGVGLAYKLAQAFFQVRALQEPAGWLELVSLGTVADLAPLRGENRVLVGRGIEALRRTKSPGLRALMDVSDVSPDQLSATHIGFMLGPRLNAAGRMESARSALELLLCSDAKKAHQLAEQLDRLNRRRQQETREVVKRAHELLPDGAESRDVIFVADEAFHEGVVGLAASRLMDEFYRPALVARREGELLRGSARSIPGFHITRALEACADDLLDFGGHQAAAGFTLRADKLDEVLRVLEEQAAVAFADRPPRREIQLDAVLALGDLSEDLLSGLEQLEPVGQGNPAPLFAVRGARVDRMRQVGREGAHLKISLTDGWRPYDGIGFRLGQRMSELGSEVDVAFHYEWNEFRGVRQPQLRIVDIR